MNLHTDRRPGAAAVTVVGRFDAHETAAFRAAVTPLVHDGLDVTVDLARTTFLDSSALAELLRARRTATAAGGDLRLAAVSDPVAVILELTSLRAALPLVPAPAPSR